jgi:hypothetical protein
MVWIDWIKPEWDPLVPEHIIGRGAVHLLFKVRFFLVKPKTELNYVINWMSGFPFSKQNFGWHYKKNRAFKKLKNWTEILRLTECPVLIRRDSSYKERKLMHPWLKLIETKLIKAKLIERQTHFYYFRNRNISVPDDIYPNKFSGRTPATTQQSIDNLPSPRDSGYLDRPYITKEGAHNKFSWDSWDRQII